MKITLKDEVKTRIWIAKQGKSLIVFSRNIDVSQGYLSQILSMKNNPSAEVAYKITNGLNVDLEDVFLFKTNDISVIKK